MDVLTLDDLLKEAAEEFSEETPVPDEASDDILRRLEEAQKQAAVEPADETEKVAKQHRENFYMRCGLTLLDATLIPEEK